MKNKILVRGPALSQSGYGEQTRFALRALQQHEDKFDIFLNTTSWGATSWITEDNEERQWFDSLLQKTIMHRQSGGQFDTSLQVTIPGEWEKLAPRNIGYTAGIETTKISGPWLEKTFLMDKIVVPSKHTQTVFETTTWKAQTADGNTVDVGCKTPVEVVSFPVKPVEAEDLPLSLDTEFNFLCVAQISARKNLDNAIKWFVEEFHDNEVGLVAKVSLSKNCLIDRVTAKNRLTNILSAYPDRKCKVYLLHGNLTEGQMKSLYTNKKIKALVTTTHGEGFGLPLFEAAHNGLPVVAPAWSGHKDFLYAPVKNKKTKKVKNRSMFTKVDYELKQVQPEAVWKDVIIPESMWCFPKERSFAMALRKVHDGYPMALSQAKKLQAHVLETFTEEAQYDAFIDALGITVAQESVEATQEWFEELNKNIESHK